MFRVHDRLIKKQLIGMNMLVSGVALLLAGLAFAAYDRTSFRETLERNLSVQAQIVGSNSVSALLFNDRQSAENTLSALRATHRILSAGIYTPDGRSFAMYWRGAIQRERLSLAGNRGSLPPLPSIPPG